MEATTTTQKIPRDENQKKKFLLIGYGNMGSAMVDPIVDDFDVTIVTPNSVPEIDCELHRTFDNVKEEFDIIMFAVKPYQIQDVLNVMPDKVWTKETQFISILVGVESEYFKNQISQDIKIARVMPSLPVAVQEGIILILDDGDDQFEYFENLGKIIRVDSVSDMEKLTSICCCAPGYIYHILENYQLAAEKMECDTNVDMKEIVYQIFKGTFKHFEANRDASFNELKSRVTSKKGTTEAGIEKMEDIDGLFETVISRSTERAYEIAEERNEGK